MTAPGPSLRRAASFGLWFGLIAGLGECALVVLRKFGLGRLVWAGPDILWMLPVADSIFFTLGALVLYGGCRAIRRPLADRWLVGVLTGVAVLSWLVQYEPLDQRAAALLAAGIGVLAGRVWRRSSVGLDRLRRWTVVPLAAVTVTLLAGAAVWHARRDGAPTGDPPAGAPNVLLLVLDTVRALDLSAYGYGRPTSPTLERVAAEGVRFAHALSTTSWTLPSHASMFTGRWPKELDAGWTRPLGDTYPTVAERLSAAGYHTAGLVANTRYCSREVGLSRGFHHYDDYQVSLAETLLSPALARILIGGRLNVRYFLRRRADEMNASVVRWLDHRPPDRPFFAFVNYLDAHAPYDPPPSHAGRFSGPRRFPRHGLPEEDIPPELVGPAVDAYDESIAYLDAKLGELLATLKARGRLENTVLIITADHGEEFGEHGEFYHGNNLYRTSLEVPLIVWWPGHVPAGMVVEEPVSLRDLASTIADLTGTRAAFPGRSLARYWTGEPPALPDTLFASLNYAPGLPANSRISRGSMVSVLLDGIRLIRNGDGQLEAFDFDRDPHERHDLASEPASRPAVARLTAVLEGLGSGEGPD